MTSNPPIPDAIADFGRRLGEGTLRPLDSFKSQVLAGDEVIVKLPEQNEKPTETDLKEQRVLRLVRERLDPAWARVVPELVSAEEVPGVGWVQAFSRLPGARPKELSEELLEELGRFLEALHSVGPFELLVEFEGDDGVEFRTYLARASDKFADKLRPLVSEDDLRLIEQAVTAIKTASESLSAEPELVLLHKDLYADNLLVGADGRLTGIVDWAAAQTGPREWEFTILRQRLGDRWRSVAETYGAPLDATLLDVCGLIQSLRFWKSFPHQADFAAQQRAYIKEILDA